MRAAEAQTMLAGRVDVDAQAAAAALQATAMILNSRFEADVPAYGGAKIKLNGAEAVKRLDELTTVRDHPSKTPTIQQVFETYEQLLGAWEKARLSGALKGGLEWPNGFREWLDTELSTNFWAVIGDFQEHQARALLNLELEKHPGKGSKGAPILDDDWRKVYEVCGGNTGALCRPAVQYHLQKHNWPAALDAVTRDTLALVERAAMDREEWTAAQFADAALLMLDSQFNAVPRKQMEAQLGRHLTLDVTKQQAAGTRVLAALVKANRFSIRPFSEWTLDITPEAYGEPRATAIVTAASAMELHCMRILRSEQEEKLDQWKRQCQAATLPIQLRPVSPELATVRDAIGVVEGKKAALEGDIAAIETEITTVKRDRADGWQEELAALRDDKKVLQAKERQLREQSLLLLKGRSSSSKCLTTVV
ncbi:hypothetical protein JKP88DRAFT_288381 [Tribonema minus]|uniref:Uncharacterized protein n=1 Tax=Tribonema minus TaxID=303371 RepID=A0A835ZB81_9STRA|nr:hypothetical protein JKP88DRAFT_288381 [Tribonema minus]